MNLFDWRMRVQPLGFVDALAALLSDDQLRAEFAQNRSMVAQQLELEVTDQRLLLALDVEQLEQQAQCLLLKRQSEASDHMPQTWKQLGSDGTRLFQEYARAAPWPAGHRRHILDAFAFCRFLKQHQPEKISDFEYSSLRFQASSRKFGIAFVKDFFLADRPQRALLVFFRNRHQHAKHYAFSLRRFRSDRRQ